MIEKVPSADDVSGMIDDLRVLIEESIPDVQRKVVSLYIQDELLNARTKVGLPAIGIVYAGMKARTPTAGRRDSSAGAIMCDANFDIFIMTGRVEDDRVTDLKVGSTNLLKGIRRAIATKTSTSSRKWQFISELPAPLAGDVLAYVQRWSTGATLQIVG